MKGPNIPRLIVISFEKKLYLETLRLNLLIQIISWLIFSLNLIFVTSLVYKIYIHKLEESIEYNGLNLYFLLVYHYFYL